MAKYKFSLSPRVRGMIEWNLEHYHEYKKSLEQYKNDIIPSTTQNYPAEIKNAVGGYESAAAPASIRGTTAQRPTENVGINIATSPYILNTERCIAAVEKALARCDDTDRMLVDLVYWKHTYNIVGAAQKVSISQTGAYKRINKILCLIALEQGYVNV